MSLALKREPPCPTILQQDPPTDALRSILPSSPARFISTPGLDAEREAVRLVILLNIISTVRTLLALLEENLSAFADATARPLSPGGQPRSPEEALAVRRLRLAPLLGLEAPIREMLGAIDAGPSANSYARQGLLPVEGQEVYGDPMSKEELDAGRSDTPPAHRKSGSRTGSRAGSPAPTDPDEPILPQSYRQRIGQLAFGNSKESRRAKAQLQENGGRNSIVDSSKNWTENGIFLANKDDPIHLLEALRPEVESIWGEAVERGLVAGEGPLQGKLGGWQPTDSAR